MIDYRLTKFENYNYSEISQNKLILGNEIDARARTNVGKHYDKIKSKESTYYEEFEKIYYQKCAYCGVSTVINTAPLYEVDHFFNELQESFGKDNTPVDHISNLMFSCKNCNQSKKEFKVNDIYDIVNPDNQEIRDIFNRGEHFEIEVSSQYCLDDRIQNFYKKMKLNYRFRKLDYLLLNLYFMKEKYPDVKRYEKLFSKLLEMRNSVPSLKKYR